jgi:hypothetical protein
MILTITLASALAFGAVREVASVNNKAQEIQKLRKELRLREGQIDLLLSQKSILTKKVLKQ